MHRFLVGPLMWVIFASLGLDLMIMSSIFMTSFRISIGIFVLMMMGEGLLLLVDAFSLGVLDVLDCPWFGSIAAAFWVTCSFMADGGGLACGSGLSRGGGSLGGSGV